MRFRKLRIVFSVWCLIACMPLIMFLACSRETRKAVTVVPEMAPDTETKGTFADQLPPWDEIATVELANYSLIDSRGLRGAPRTQLDESKWHILGESFRDTKPVHVHWPIPVIGDIRIATHDGQKVRISLYITSDGGVVFRAYTEAGDADRPYFITPDKQRIVTLLPKQ